MEIQRVWLHLSGNYRISSGMIKLYVFTSIHGTIFGATKEAREVQVREESQKRLIKTAAETKLLWLHLLASK